MEFVSEAHQLVLGADHVKCSLVPIVDDNLEIASKCLTPTHVGDG